MADLTEIINKYKSKEIDPITGLESRKPESPESITIPKSNYRNIGSTLGITYRDPLTSSTPIIDLNQAFDDRSKTDKELTARDVLNIYQDPELLTDIRAGKQSNVDAIGNSLIKLGAKTGVNVVGSIIGGGYGIASAILNGNISKLWDNDVINETIRWSEELDKSLPVYKDREYLNKNFGQSLLNFGMFLDEYTDAVAFTLGSVASAYITAGLATPSRFASLINKANRITRGIDAVTKLGNLEKAAFLADDILGNARRIYTSFGYEAAFEAHMAGKQMTDKLEDSIRKEEYSKLQEEIDKLINTPAIRGALKYNNEQEPYKIAPAIEEEIQRLKDNYEKRVQERLLVAKESINKAQLGVYIANAALLYGTSAFQFSNTFGVRWNNAIKPKPNVLPKGVIGLEKTATKTAGEVVQEGAEAATKQVVEEGAKEAVESTVKQGIKAVDKALPKTKIGKLADDVWTFVKNPVAEGIVEEGGQGIFSTGFQNYYGSRFDPEVFGESKDFLETFGDAFSHQFTSKEGWKEVLMGMLIGGMGAPGKGLLPGNLGINEETGKRGKYWTGGIVGSFQERTEERERYQNLIDEVNKTLVNYTDIEHATVNSFLAVQAANNRKSEAIGKEDKFEALNARDDSFFAGIYARERAGLADSHDSAIKEMEKMTPDEFINSYSTDESDKNMTDEEKKNFKESTIKQIKDHITRVRESMKHINRLMPSDPINNYNPEIEEYKEQLAYIAYKGEALQYRYNQLLDFIENNKGNAAFSKDELDNLVKKLNILNMGNRGVVTTAIEALRKSQASQDRITAQLEKFESGKESLNKKISSRNDAIEITNERIKSLTEEMENLDKEITKLKADEKHAYELRENIKSKEIVIKDLVTKKSQIDKKIKELKARLDVEPENKDRILKDLEDANKSISAINDNIDKINKEIAEIENDEKFGDEWLDSLLADIINKEKIRDNTAKNIENLTNEVGKHAAKIEELQKRLAKAEQIHTKNISRLKQASDIYKQKYVKTLEAMKLIAEEKSKNRGVKFEYSKFDDYAKEVLDTYVKSHEIHRALTNIGIETNPLKADEVLQALTDLGRLEFARLEAAEIMNYFLSKRGKDAFKAKMIKKKRELFDAKIVRTNDIKKREQEISSDPRIANTTNPDGVHYSYKVKIDGEDKTIKGLVTKDTDGTYIFVTLDPNEVIDEGENGEKFNAITLNELTRREYDGEITDLKEMTQEELDLELKINKASKSISVDNSSNKVVVKPTILENKETGERFAIINKTTIDGKEYTDVHLINNDGTIQAIPLPKYDIPNIEELVPIESIEELNFEGELVLFKDTRNGNEGKELTGLLVYESPFLHEGEAEHRSTYPTKLRFIPIDKKSTQIVIEDTSKENEELIKELVDKAMEAMSSGNREVYNNTNKPIIEYNGVKGYLDYNIKQRKYYIATNKKGKKYKKYYYVFPGKQKVKSIILQAAEGITEEDLNNAIENQELNHNHFKSLIGKSKNFSNYDINDIEVVQEDFVSKSGEHYIIFRDSSDPNKKLYAAKKEKVIYEIYGQTGQLSRRGVIVRSEDYKKTKYDSYKLIIREGEYKYIDEKEDSELGEHTNNSIRIGASIPHLSFTAGREVEYEVFINDKGKEILKDRYNEDGTYSKNPDTDQVRWFNFLKNAFKTTEEVDEYRKNHFLKVVINTTPEHAKYFDQKDPFSKQGLDEEGYVLYSGIDEVLVKLVLVKRNDDGTFEDVLVDGKPLVTTMHTSEYDKLDAGNEEATKHVREQHRNLRESIFKVFNEARETGSKASILLPIVNVTTGKAGREMPISVVTEEGQKFRRARFPVIGRIVPKGTRASRVPWMVVTSGGSADATVYTDIEIDGVTYRFKRPISNIGQVISVIKGANGDLIPVTLLTRNLTEQEAITVAALVRKAVVDNKNEFDGMKIIPNAKDDLKLEEFYLKRFIKYGKKKAGNTKTQFYWSHKEGVLYVGKEKFTTDRIKTDEGFDSLVAAIQAAKIHTVNNSYRGSAFNISYLDKTGKVVQQLKFDTYEDYLFEENIRGNNPPILQTDVFPYGSEDSVVQVNIEFGDPSINGDEANKIYNRKEYKIKADSKSDSKSSTNTNIENSDKKETTKSNIDSSALVSKNLFVKKESTQETSNTVDKEESPTEIVKEAKVPASLFQSTNNNTNTNTTNKIPNSDLGGNKSGLLRDGDEDNKPRLVKLKDIREKVNVEDLDKVRAWFKENLPNIPLEIEDNFIELIRGKAWGVFTGSVVKIYKEAEEGTGYHEAFHVVAEYGLTNRQKKALLDVMREQTGSKSLTWNEAEELIAEDFRIWKLTGMSSYDRGTVEHKKNSIFTYLKNLINKIISLIRGEKYIESLIDLYSKIDIGTFKDIRPKENIGELSKDLWKPREFEGFSVIETEDLITGLSNIIIDRIFTEYGGKLNLLTNRMEDLIKDSLYYSLLINDENTNKPQEHILPEDIRIRLIDVYKDDTRLKQFVDLMIQHFRYLGMGIDISKDVEFEEHQSILESIKEEGGRDKVSEFADSNSVSNLLHMSNEVRILLSTLYQIDDDGNVKRNSMGFPKSVDPSTAYVTLLEELSGSIYWEDMEKKLDILAKEKSEYEVLKERLNGLKGLNRILIRNRFRQAMSINRFNYMTYLLNKNGGTYINSSVNRSIDRLREQLDSAYKSTDSYARAKVNPKSENSYIRSYIKENLSSPKNKELFNRNFRELLAYIGFDQVFNVDRLLSSNYKLDLLDAIIDMFSKDVAVEDITTFTSGRLRKALIYEASNRAELYEPQVTTSNNKVVYPYGFNNYYSTVINIINSSKSSEELFSKLPYLRKLGKSSVWLNNILTDYERGVTPNISIVVYEGIRDDVYGTEGEVAFEAQRPDLIRMHIESMLAEESYPLRRPSDKSLEVGIKGMNLNMPLFFSDIETKSRLLGYIKYDLANNNNKKLLIFDSILSDNTKSLVLSNPNKVDLFINDIFKDYKRYIKDKANKYIEYLTNNKIINKNKVLLSSTLISKYSGSGSFDVDRFALDFAEVYFAKTIEQHILFLGNFDEFTQLFKRTSGAVGSGETFTDDDETIKFLQDGYIAQLNSLPKSKISERLDLIANLTEEQRAQFKPYLKNLREFEEIIPNTSKSVNITILDDFIVDLEQENPEQFEFIKEELWKEIDSRKISDKEKKELLKVYLAPYKEINVADGLGYISFEKYREFLLKSGTWTPLQESTYQSIISGKKLSKKDISAVFPIIKPQAFGPINYMLDVSGEDIFSKEFKGNKIPISYAKLSLIPLDPFENMPSERANLIKSMQMSGTHIAIHKSGLKQAKYPFSETFDGAPKLFKSFNQSDIFWKLQVKIHPEIEEEDIDGTQQRMYTFLDLFDNGVPVDFDGTRQDWDKLTLEEKLDRSNIKKLYTDYVDTYKTILDMSLNNFLEESGIIANETGEYVIRDKKRFVKSLVREINNRRLPTNIIKAISITEDGEFKFPLDALPIADKIENMLFARAINSTIRIKRQGAAYIQTSNLYWKDSDTEKAREYAERLKFIRREDGKIVAAEVFLPNYMRGLVGDLSNEEIETLRETNPKVLMMVGYRIPTQGQNSMLPLIVKGFLPNELGDTVVVPYEIVAQSSSDFDIDKLHIFRPNVLVDVSGTPMYIDPNEDPNSILEKVNKNKVDSKILYSLVKNGITPEAKFLLRMFNISEEEFIDDTFNRKKELRGFTIEDIISMQQQNRLLEIQLELLTSKHSIRNILVPNGSFRLKQDSIYVEYLESLGTLSPDIVDMVIKRDSQDFKNYLKKRTERQTSDQLLDFEFEIETGMAFKVGKRGVAISANAGKFHSIAQQYGLYLNTTYYTSKTELTPDGIMVVKSITPVKLNFECNIENNGGVIRVPLGKRRSITQDFISDYNSEHLTANVDVAKDPFIFRINTNTYTSGVKYFMLSLGADLEWVDLFLSQPIIKEFVREVLINQSKVVEATRYEENSVYKSTSNILNDLIKKYGGEILYKKLAKSKLSAREFLDSSFHHAIDKIYTKEELAKGIYYGNKEDSRLLSDISTMQITLLANFLNYMDYAKEFSKVIRNTKPDTDRIKNHTEALGKNSEIQEIIETNLIGNLHNIFNDYNGILNPFSKVSSPMLTKLYRDAFITQSETILRDVYKTIIDDLKASNRFYSEKQLDKIRQGIITNLMQIALNRAINEDTGYNSLPVEYVKKLMVGRNSAAKILSKIKGSKMLSTITDLLDSMLFSKIGEDSSSVDYISVSGRKMDPSTAERVAAEFEILRSAAPEIYNMLLAVTLIQTGVVYSPLNFTKHIDSDVMSSILSPVLNRIKRYGISSVLNLNETEPYNFIDNFYLINRRDPVFVPIIRIRSNNSVIVHPDHKETKDVLIIGKSNFNFGRKFVKTVDKVYIDGKAQYIDIVYKLEGFIDESAIYVKINPKGSYRNQEYHTGTKSIDKSITHENNYISDRDRDRIIKSIFGTVKPTTKVKQKNDFDDISLTMDLGRFNLLTYDTYLKMRNIEIRQKSREEFMEFKTELDAVSDLATKSAMWEAFLNCD